MTLELVLVTAYLISGALMLFLGFVVLRENPRQRVNRATASMLVFGGLGPILGAISSLSARSSEHPVVIDLFEQFGFLWEFFFPSVLYFSLVFPSLHPVLQKRPRLAFLIFLPHAFHVLLVLLMGGQTNILDRLDPSGWFPWMTSLFEQGERFVRLGLGLLLDIHVRFFSFINLSMAVASWALLVRSAQRTPNPKLRAQVRTIALGLGVSLALYSGGDLVPALFGVEIDRSLRLPLVTVSLLVGAVCIVVAIVRLQFLDVRFIVRRGLVYGLASGVIVAVYLFAGKQMDRLSAQLMGQNLPVFETTFLVLSLFLLQPVLSNIEAFVDRVYSRDRADLRNTLNRLSEEISLLLDPGNVRELVAGTLCREMVLKNAAVVSLDRSTRAFSLARAGPEAGTEANWGGGPALFHALQGRRDPVSAGELGELPDDENERNRLVLELERLGVQTVFPMHAALRDGVGEIVGALMLGEKVTETRLTFEETTLVSMVAHQVGISLTNGMLHKEQIAARLIEEEIATARKIQRNLLPENPPELRGWELCASNRPSRDVGGDYHDFLPLPGGHLGIAIGDVSGKGIPAALLMSNLQAVLRVQVLAGLPAHKLVEEVNRHIYRTTGLESFISFFLGELEPSLGTFTYTNAGHNAPIVVRECGDVETLDIGGLLLGVFPHAMYERGSIKLNPGDLIAFYTDGVTEATNEAGDMFSEERLVEALHRHRGACAREIHDTVLERVREFQCGRSPDDDLTLILVKRDADADFEIVGSGERAG
jgi:sigma-B regulation protein RsbU (phosphoserine phosphatase)